MVIVASLGEKINKVEKTMKVEEIFLRVLTKHMIINFSFFIICFLICSHLKERIIVPFQFPMLPEFGFFLQIMYSHHGGRMKSQMILERTK